MMKNEEEFEKEVEEEVERKIKKMERNEKD